MPSIEPKPPAHTLTDILSVDRWAGWRWASTTGMPSIMGLRLPETPQDVALDLAGHRLRQLGVEADDVRVLVALQPVLAEVLELGDEVVAGGGGHLRAEQDVGPDLHETLDVD